MQRKYLGMAVAAALAAPGMAIAQSTVQLYGTAHMSVSSTRYGQSAAGVESVRKLGVNSHSSNFGIRSTEDLGRGLQAWVQYEFNVKMERDNDVTAGNGSARNTGVGLRGGFGNVYFGTWESPWAQTFRLWDVGAIGGYGITTAIIGRREQTGQNPSRNCGNYPNGAQLTAPTVVCLPAESSNGPGYALWRRFSHSVFYESPMFGGVQLKLAYMPNEQRAVFGAPIGTATSTYENPSAWSGSLTWTGLGGNARVFIATMQAKDWTTVGQKDGGFTVGGGYNFGVVNIGATLERYDYETTAGALEAEQLGISASIPLGQGRVGLSWARAKDFEGPVTAATDDNGAKMWAVGYEHALSKRTAAYIGYAKIDNESDANFTWTGLAPQQTGVGVAPLAGSDVTNLFVGLRHSF